MRLDWDWISIFMKMYVFGTGPVQPTVPRDVATSQRPPHAPLRDFSYPAEHLPFLVGRKLVKGRWLKGLELRPCCAPALELGRLSSALQGFDFGLVCLCIVLAGPVLRGVLRGATKPRQASVRHVLLPSSSGSTLGGWAAMAMSCVWAIFHHLES